MSAEAGYALLGASVGGAASIITTLITIRHEGRKVRDQREHELRLELGRKQLELKSNTIADINDSIIRIIVPIMKVEERNIEYHTDSEGNIIESPLNMSILKKARDDEYYNNFIIRRHVIQSNIQTYFIGCLKHWDVLTDFVEFILNLSDRWELDDRAKLIQNHVWEFAKN